MQNEGNIHDMVVVVVILIAITIAFFHRVSSRICGIINSKKCKEVILGGYHTACEYIDYGQYYDPTALRILYLWFIGQMVNGLWQFHEINFELPHHQSTQHRLDNMHKHRLFLIDGTDLWQMLIFGQMINVFILYDKFNEIDLEWWDSIITFRRTICISIGCLYIYGMLICHFHGSN